MVATKSVKFGKIELGTGKPKIAVPITGKTEAEILQQAEKVIVEKPDLVEWRIDFFEGVTDKISLQQTSEKLRSTLDTLPLLTTFRTKSEGGELSLDDNGYFKICANIIEFGNTDGLDIELNHDEAEVKKLLFAAKNATIVSVMSNHDFEKTPQKSVIVDRLTKMSELGSDVAKMAVMPQTNSDVLTLLTATSEVSQTMSIPVITMSMGDLGKVTRISGETFGSCLTFATVGAASAPGQIPIKRLRADLDDLSL